MARSTKRKGNRANTLPAKYADRHLLYQWSVQAPEYEVRFMDRIFQERRDRQALSMREDFCGTAFLSAAWVKSDPQRTAVGLDLDGPTLQWGRQHTWRRWAPTPRA